MATARLTRSETDRKIAGVAGGLAAYFGLDPTLVRIAWVIAAVFAGTGFLAYIVLWIVLPVGDEGAPARRLAEERYARGEITREELDQIRSDLSRRA